MEGWREGTALAVGSCGRRLSARSQTSWLVAVFTLSTFSCAPISLLFPLLLSSLRSPYSPSLLLGLRSFVVPITAPAAVAAAAPLCLHVMPPAHSIMAWPNHAARILRASARVPAEY